MDRYPDSFEHSAERCIYRTLNAHPSGPSNYNDSIGAAGEDGEVNGLAAEPEAPVTRLRVPTQDWQIVGGGLFLDEQQKDDPDPVQMSVARVTSKCGSKPTGENHAQKLLHSFSRT
jgi:hypothetical protein